jgi:hypothetical protein
MARDGVKIYDYADELMATPSAHIRMELRQEQSGLTLLHNGEKVVECYLNPEGMMAGGFMAQALGVPIPPLGESVPVRVSSGVLYRAIGVADLDYSVEESAIILERLLEEAELQRGSAGSVSEL